MSERREKRLLYVASVRIEESLTLKKLRNPGDVDENNHFTFLGDVRGRT
jgi:hypothetical protein